jgi:hypothetical protein
VSVLIDADKLIAVIDERGKAWAEAQAEFRRLEDLEKTILAQITEAMQAETKSHAAAETKARASTQFKEFLEKKADARLEYGLSTARYDKIKLYIEMQRSNQAYKRAEMSML